MVIINKKRIQIIISALLVGIFTFSLQIANNNQKGEKNKNQNNESVIQTTATPVSGKTVVLDAGMVYQMKVHKVAMERLKQKQI